MTLALVAFAVGFGARRASVHRIAATIAVLAAGHLLGLLSSEATPEVALWMTVLLAPGFDLAPGLVDSWRVRGLGPLVSFSFGVFLRCVPALTGVVAAGPWPTPPVLGAFFDALVLAALATAIGRRLPRPAILIPTLFIASALLPLLTQGRFLSPEPWTAATFAPRALAAVLFALTVAVADSLRTPRGLAAAASGT